jgi:hypothetical protein
MRVKSVQKLPVSPAVDTAAGALVVLPLPAVLEEAELEVEPEEPELAEEAELAELGAEVLAALVAEPPEQALSIRQSPAAAAVIAAAPGVDRSGDNVVPSFSGRGWPQHDAARGVTARTLRV